MNRSFAILALVSLQAFAYTGQSSCRVAGPGVVICSLTEGSERHVSSYIMGKDHCREFLSDPRPCWKF